MQKRNGLSHSILLIEEYSEESYRMVYLGSTKFNISILSSFKSNGSIYAKSYINKLIKEKKLNYLK